jgi:hypothetical protein
MAGKSEIVLVQQLSDFFSALGYKTIAEDRRLVVEDTALLSTSRQVIVAGNAQYIDDGEVTRDPPRFVVIEDGAPQSHIERLTLACAVAKSPPKLVSFSRFIDPLWQADLAAKMAQADATSASDLDIATGLSDVDRSNPGALYADQVVRTESESPERHSALIHCEKWLESGEGNLVVLAPAGLGKSELTAVLEWRAALNHFNASSKKGFEAPPPLALRVQLRDLSASGLSLDALADYLRGFRGLERIRNGQVLAQLLLHRRLVLLLDGLDELPIPRARMEEGLADINFYAESGARVMITSRMGYYGSEGAIRAKLRRESIVVLEALDESAGLDLLAKRGASIEEARSAFSSLKPELRGVPLFLIWAWKSGFGEEKKGHQVAGRAAALINFVRLFCIRDEPRVRLPADSQMDALTDLAYQSTFVGDVTRTDFAYLVGEEEGPMVEGPHALLRQREDGMMVFREATFENLFLAQGIVRGWHARREGGVSDLKVWLGDRIGAIKLESLTVEFLAEFLSDAEVREAWLLGSEAPARYQPFTRRNVLAIVLAKLREQGDGKSATNRAGILASLLGTKDISDTVLLDLVIEQVDFAGWNLGGCVGRGAYLAFCNFEGAIFDSGLDGADVVEGSGLSAKVPEEEILRLGMRRLQRVLVPWRNHAVGETALKPELSEETRGLDAKGMRILRTQGLANMGSGKRGVEYWRLTDEAKRLFRELLNNPSVPSPQIKELLMKLGAT